MPDAAWLGAALLGAQLGMAWLAQSLDVHWRQVHGAASRAAPTLLRPLGFAALAASLVFCLFADAATMAVLVWMMLLAVTAVTIALTLSWCPRALSRTWLAGS